MDRRFFLFVIVGGINTVFGWCVFSLSIFLGADYWLALIVGMVLGVFFNFLSIGRGVFKDISWRRVPRFVLSYSVIYALNLIFLKVLEVWVGSPVLRQLFLTPVIAVVSYMVLSRLVFSRDRRSGN